MQVSKDLKGVSKEGECLRLGVSASSSALIRIIENLQTWRMLLSPMSLSGR